MDFTSLDEVLSDKDDKSSQDKRGKNKEKIMSLLDHLDELRSCALKSVLAVLTFFCFALFFSSKVINYLKVPLANVLPNNAKVLHFTGPLEVFMASIKTSFLVSLILASPVWIYQFWKFVEPALYEKEKRYVTPFIFFSIALFFSGVLFSYFLILPLALEFLIGLGLEVGSPIITISDYLSLLTIMILGFGVTFEAPLILVLLATLDLLTSKMLIEYRKYVIIIILFIAAILTPPDPLSQIGLAIPLYLMYELSILVIRLIERKRHVN